MSGQMDRRTFLGQAARTAAIGAALGHLRLDAADQPASQPASGPASQPAAEWRNKQPGMAYAKLGRTNFMVSRCVFAAGGVRGPDDLPLLELAVERGVNYLDTGRWYRSSESAISEFVRRHREKCWIVSKAAHIGWPDMTVKQGEDDKAAKLYTTQLDESLRTLKVDTIDCYMVQGVEHDWIVTMDSLYDAFSKARKAGKVRYFGLATHNNVPKVCELAAASGRYDVIMVAANPNSLKSLAPAIKAMRDAGIGLVSMKTSGPIVGDPKVYDEQYDPVLAGLKLSAYQRAYVYMLNRGGIDAFNSSTPNRTILEENLAAAAVKLSQAELDLIERQTFADARGACHHCGHCNRACPNGVRPADLLRCHTYLHTYGDRALADATYQATLAADCTSCGTCQVACPESIDLPAAIAAVRLALA
jgi:hypothetical protein